MKTKFLLLSALAALTFVACQRVNDGLLRLYVEGMGDGAKMAAEGGASYWATGDQVRINNELVTVSIDESAGTATAVSSGEGFQAPYFGVYPAAIYASNSGDSYTLNLPPCYTYTTTTHFGSTMQNLGTPMVAYSASGTELLFKHVTAALNVKVVNDFGVDVRVTDITISSNKYQLSGATTLTVGGDINVDPVSAEGDGNAALRQVQMTFGGTQLIVPCGGTAVVQVPVLPVGDDNRFTISVTVQNKDDADMSWTFSKTQAGNSSDGYALGRAMVGYAPAKFGGVFSVADNKQVRFAPGNLQYYLGSISEGVSRWSFKSNQYSRSTSIVSGYYSTSTTQPDKDGYIDLFGWGASGIVGSATKYLPWQYAWSGSFREDVGNADMPTSIDWGYNAIKNGGNATGLWHTLTSDEWAYLLNTREVEGYVNTVSRATVENVQGLIILPDNFVDPNTNSSANHSSFYPGPNSFSIAGFTDNVYSGDGWAAMEAVGVVFLPVCGYRSGGTTLNKFSENYIWYWTSTSTDGTNMQQANAMTNNNSSIKPSATNPQSRLYGLPVRLVRDVQ